MKLVRHCLIVSTVCALSACSSSSSVHVPLFNKRPVRQTATTVQPAAAAETPPAAAAPAPAAPVTPVEVPVPVAETPPVVPPPAPVVVVAPEPAPAPAAVPASAPASELKATRAGRLVQLAWTLPVNEAGYRTIEVMRNTSELPKGRTRVKALRPTVTQLDDTVESATERYWYWLKLTDQNQNVTNLGPVEAVETTR